jgi:hypothetical protein
MLNELERKDEELKLKQVAGTPRHIQINEKTLEATKQEFRNKGLEVTNIPSIQEKSTILSGNKRNSIL